MPDSDLTFHVGPIGANVTRRRTFVADGVESAIRRARAAGDRAVGVAAASLAQHWVP